MTKKIVCICLAIFLLMTFATACDTKDKAGTKMNVEADENNNAENEQTAETEGQTELPESTPTVEPYDGELTSILLMGSMDADFNDENQNYYTLTHILITLDPKTRSLRFTTFPYNLNILPSVEGAQEQQLQFVQMQYGPEATVATLEERFDIDIDSWVIMNMDGVVGIIDALGGLEIEIENLSINEIGDTVNMILGYVWHEIVNTGKQVLDGIQTSGYFMDTYYNLSEDTPAIDEEMEFRYRHESIIDALIYLLKTEAVSDEDIINIAGEAKDNFITDIADDEWEALAKLAIACLNGEQQYLHIPSMIISSTEGYMTSLVYAEETDRELVSAFVRGEQ